MIRMDSEPELRNSSWRGFRRHWYSLDVGSGNGVWGWMGGHADRRSVVEGCKYFFSNEPLPSLGEEKEEEKDELRRIDTSSLQRWELNSTCASWEWGVINVNWLSVKCNHRIIYILTWITRTVNTTALCRVELDCRRRGIGGSRGAPWLRDIAQAYTRDCDWGAAFISWYK